MNPETVSSGGVVLRGVALKFGVSEETLLSREDSDHLREARRYLYRSLRSLNWSWWRIGGFCKRHEKVVRRVCERREEPKGEILLIEGVAE